MALNSFERTNLIELVVAMFDLAPGATYLADLALAYESNGRSLAELAKTLTDTVAYKSLNPVSQTAAEFTKGLLTPLGLQDNTVAIDFVTAKFNAGVSKGQIAYDVVAALDATTDPAFRYAQITLANKVSVAEYFSVTKAIPTTDLARLHAAIDDVRAVYSSVDAALKAIDDGSYFQAPASTGTTGGSTSGSTSGTTKPPATGGTTNPPNTSPPEPTPDYYPADDPPPAGSGSSGGSDPASDPWSDSEHMGPPPPPPPDPMDPMGMGFDPAFDPAMQASVMLVGLAGTDLFGAVEPTLV